METVEQIISSLKLKRAPLKAQITRQPNLNNQTQFSTQSHSSLKSSTTSNNACAMHETSSHYSAFLSADQSVSTKAQAYTFHRWKSS